MQFSRSFAAVSPNRRIGSSGGTQEDTCDRITRHARGQLRQDRSGQSAMATHLYKTKTIMKTVMVALLPLRWVGGALGARAKALLKLQIGKLGRGGSGRPLAHHKRGRVVGARWSPEDVVKSKPAVEEHALTRANMHAHAHAHAQRATINAHLWRHIPTNTQERTHTNQHTCVHSLARLHER